MPILDIINKPKLKILSNWLGDPKQHGQQGRSFVEVSNGDIPKIIIKHTKHAERLNERTPL